MGTTKQKAEAKHFGAVQYRTKLLYSFATWHEGGSSVPWRGQRAQNVSRLLLVSVMLLLLLGVHPAGAETIPVTISSPDIIDDGECSLIEAIENANDNVDGSVYDDWVLRYLP